LPQLAVRFHQAAISTVVFRISQQLPAGIIEDNYPDPCQDVKVAQQLPDPINVQLQQHINLQACGNSCS
jgi:hypothetical protein